LILSDWMLIVYCCGVGSFISYISIFAKHKNFHNFRHFREQIFAKSGNILLRKFSKKSKDKNFFFQPYCRTKAVTVLYCIYCDPPAATLCWATPAQHSPHPISPRMLHCWANKPTCSGMMLLKTTVRGRVKGMSHYRLGGVQCDMLRKMRISRDYKRF
jgi:hypothetical protein